jgi:hypothetical protein
MEVSLSILVGVVLVLAGGAIVAIGLWMRVAWRHGLATHGKFRGAPAPFWRLVPTPENQWVQAAITLREGTFRIGRLPTNDFVLPCEFISRHHAVLQVAGGRLSLLGAPAHSKVHVCRVDRSRFQALGTTDEFHFTVGDLLAFSSPRSGMVFQVQAGLDEPARGQARAENAAGRIIGGDG